MKEAPYAWVVVWATFVALAIIFGVSYSFAAFFVSFAGDFSAQRADLALVFGLSGGVYFVFGAGLGIALVYTPAIACVQPWFTQRCGLAAGLASSGIGAGTVEMALVATAAIGALRWRDAIRAMALGVLVLGLCATWLLRRAPLRRPRPAPAGYPG